MRSSIARAPSAREPFVVVVGFVAGSTACTLFVSMFVSMTFSFALLRGSAFHLWIS
jgi:hypothetical protein